MSRIIWNDVGMKRFETGLDRGVLYGSDGLGVPWNGLVSVEELVGDVTHTARYIDGVKYLDERSPTEYAAKLSALTYPDEFLEFEGVSSPSQGVFASDQPVMNRFGLSWRTLLGNDVNGVHHAYRLHIAYNLLAIPDNRMYNTLSDSPELTDFGWTITGVPPEATTHRPTAHFFVDSNVIASEELEALELILYGDESNQARIPTIEELIVVI